MIATKPYTSSHCLSFTLKKTQKQNHATFYLQKYSSVGNASVVFCSFASAETPKWEFPNGNHNSVVKSISQIKNREQEEEEEKGVISGERKVKCDVEVISWRERRIRAEISVNADIESVWYALTDYERLADFIPNLVSR